MSTITQGDVPSATSQTPQRCAATRKDGQPCTRRAVPDSPLCVFHDSRATEWRSQGGKATRRSAKVLRLLPDRLRPIVDTLISAIDEVHAGTLAPAQASAMASLASALVRVFTAGEVEERLRELERRAAAYQGEEWQREPQPSVYPASVYAVPAATPTPATPAAAAVESNSSSQPSTEMVDTRLPESNRHATVYVTTRLAQQQQPAKPKQPKPARTPTWIDGTTTRETEAALRERWLTGGFDGSITVEDDDDGD